MLHVYSGAMTGMPYSLPRSSDYLDEQKMDVVTDTGMYIVKVTRVCISDTGVYFVSDTSVY